MLQLPPHRVTPSLKQRCLSRADITQLMKIYGPDRRNDERRPNTKYVFYHLANIVYFIYNLEYVLGKGGERLPAFISNRRCIIDLHSDQNNKHLYKDRYCFFRCLALYRGATVQALERPTQILLDQWCVYKGTHNFKGIQLRDILEVFKVNINIYEVIATADGIEHTAKAVYVSTSMHESTMHMNLYKNHLS